MRNVVALSAVCIIGAVCGRSHDALAQTCTDPGTGVACDQEQSSSATVNCYKIHPMNDTDTIAFMTSVVLTKQGQVAIGASTIFVVGTAQYTQAATSQITGTYTGKTLKDMCTQVGVEAVVNPEYQELDTKTMELIQR